MNWWNRVRLEIQTKANQIKYVVGGLFRSVADLLTGGREAEAYANRLALETQSYLLADILPLFKSKLVRGPGAARIMINQIAAIRSIIIDSGASLAVVDSLMRDLMYMIGDSLAELTDEILQQGNPRIKLKAGPKDEPCKLTIRKRLGSQGSGVARSGF